MKDVKNYFQTVASRLSQAFRVETFGVEEERDFWSLAAEIASRRGVPGFNDMVRWIDLIYEAPLHGVYRKTKSGQMRLVRRLIIPENLRKLAGNEEFKKEAGRLFGGGSIIKELEEQLDHLQQKIEYREIFNNIDYSTFNIGLCEHIPLFDDGDLWGIYVAGPYVRSPEVMRPKLSIAARLISRFMQQHEDREQQDEHEFEEQMEAQLGRLGADRFDLPRMAGFFVRYLMHLRGADTGCLVELHDGRTTVVADHQLPDTLQRVMEGPLGDVLFLNRGKKLEASGEDRDRLNKAGIAAFQVLPVESDKLIAYLFLGYNGRPDEQQVRPHPTVQNIVKTMRELLEYRDRNERVSGTLIDTYYGMLRVLEKQQRKTYFHTPRVEALADRFADFFGLEPDEREKLATAARLHDIGYVGAIDIQEEHNVGSELEHPVIGGTMIESLPLSNDIKEGIRTHHEWINGSGSPRGLKEDQIPWIGKVLALTEFMAEYIEERQEIEEAEPGQEIDKLADALVKRADKQFDMMLIPTAVEMIQELGWEGCLKLGAA